MIDSAHYRFNKKLLISLLVISLILIVRLFMVATKTNNWPGFWYSSLHVLIVAVGSYYTIKQKLS
ncbi:MAG: hypothetical protein KDD62_12445 [Bdellovibrionales bacterium]|nr:hypothetical protein [Bdellovibrionales bacterium]